MSLEEIAQKFNVRPVSALAVQGRAIRNLGADSLQEALQKAGRLLEEWETYFHADSKPVHADQSPYWNLKEHQLAVIRLKAAGLSDPEVARELKLPVTTVQGRRAWAVLKLRAKNCHEAVSKALDQGLIGPDEPSPRLLLRICEELAEGEHEPLVRSGQVGKPTARQLEALRLLAAGLTPLEAAERMRCTNINVNMLLRRIYRLFGAENLAGALKRIAELGLAGQGR